jgi:hypothetical protein
MWWFILSRNKLIKVHKNDARQTNKIKYFNILLGNRADSGKFVVARL